MKYGPKIKADIRKRFVEGEPAAQIAKSYANEPTSMQILNWAHKPDPESGRTWLDEKRDYELESYEDLSGQSQAEKILKKIDRFISKSDRSFTTKDADALSKLQKLMEKIVDRKFQLPTMLYFQKRYVDFMKARYPVLVNEEFINAQRHFVREMKEEFK